MIALRQSIDETNCSADDGFAYQRKPAFEFVLNFFHSAGSTWLKK